MTSIDGCRPLRDAHQWLGERCITLFPCLSDPVRRSSLGLMVALLSLHVITVGFLFAFDRDLIRSIGRMTWYSVLYLVLFVVVLIQYFFTSGSSPGYVIDEMNAGNEPHATFSTSRTSMQSAARRNDSPISPLESYHLRKNITRMNSAAWTKLVTELYPSWLTSRNWTCAHCNIVQPPRSKHCHDCNKCVLQFDHHCLWLGTCVGLRNHCRFWWYLFEETLLCMWTIILYYFFLRSKFDKAWWKEGFAIIFLAVLIICLIFLLLLLVFHSYLVMTNQTTYELVRRRRIPYLERVPESVHPFSKGLWGNLVSFCFPCDRTGPLERVPTEEELQAKARPYACVDFLHGRCCC
ncbi:unnamed protein product [Spirodela intermedia]|uniref:S-acyltransferase n=1 Tax=Spirodela intermedia TaxID=51605 RepID=A0A7I8LN76_SPIIN|nr:unnamed protein product [Spirodela intermedia]